MAMTLALTGCGTVWERVRHRSARWGAVPWPGRHRKDMRRAESKEQGTVRGASMAADA